MDSLLHLDLIKFITSIGYMGVFLIILIETGVIFGFFFPGDSLLFTAGFLASQGLFNLYIFCLLVFVGSILGNLFGYAFGKRAGQALYTKKDSFFFRKSHIAKTKHFFEKHGNKTIFFARFFPIIRTFTPIMAGVGNMPYRAFLLYTICGGFVWTIGLTLLGYFLGKTIPNVDRYLIPIVGAIILISLVPAIFHLFKKNTS